MTSRTSQHVYGLAYAWLLEEYARLPLLPESEFDEDRLPALIAAMEIVEELLYEDQEADDG